MGRKYLEKDEQSEDGLTATSRAILSDLRAIAEMRVRSGSQFPADMRNSARVPGAASAYIRREDGRNIEGALHDLSLGGALLEIDTALNSGEACQLSLASFTDAVKISVRAVKSEWAHVAFVDLRENEVEALSRYLENHANLLDGDE